MNKKNNVKKGNKVLEFKHNLNVVNKTPSFKLKAFFNNYFHVAFSSNY